MDRLLDQHPRERRALVQRHRRHACTCSACWSSAFALRDRRVTAGAHARRDSLGWLGIVRLGLVQTALGAVVVLATSTLNRVMVVEYALPAIVPGALVALHYAVQMLRPRLGHGSDVGGRRTPLDRRRHGAARARRRRCARVATA